MTQSVLNEIVQLHADASGTLRIESRPTPSDSRFEVAATSHKDTIVACGGRDERGYLSSYGFLMPIGDRAHPIRPMPSPRARHAACAHSGRLLVVGGISEDSSQGLCLAKEILAYDSDRDTWEVIAYLPRPASQLVAECVNGHLYVIAGDTGIVTEPGRPIAPARCRNDVQVLDLASGNWSLRTPKPMAETGVTSAVHGSEIFVVSSYDDRGTVNALVEVYNTTTDRWRRVPDMPTPRTGVPCGFIGSKLYCINGQGADLKPVSVVEAYDLATNTWSSIKGGPKPYIAQGYAVVANRIILVGGRSGGA